MTGEIENGPEFVYRPYGDKPMGGVTFRAAVYCMTDVLAGPSTTGVLRGEIYGIATDGSGRQVLANPSMGETEWVGETPTVDALVSMQLEAMPTVEDAKVAYDELRREWRTTANALGAYSGPNSAKMREPEGVKLYSTSVRLRLRQLVAECVLKTALAPDEAARIARL